MASSAYIRLTDRRTHQSLQSAAKGKTNSVTMTLSACIRVIEQAGESEKTWRITWAVTPLHGPQPNCTRFGLKLSGDYEDRRNGSAESHYRPDKLTKTSGRFHRRIVIAD